MNRSALKLLLFSTLILALSASAAAYALHEQNAKGKRLLASMEGLESWIHLNRARIDLASEADTGTSDRERLESLVLRGQNDTIAFLAHIDRLGDMMGVDIGTQDLKSDRTAEPHFDEIVATLSLRGPAAAVERMIALLEALPYRSRVERLALTRREAETEATVVVRVSILE